MNKIKMKNIINIVDFYSPNCAPCTLLKKELEGLDNVEYVNVMEDFEKALQYNIRKAPTVIILENGEEINRFSGFKTKEEIASYLE